MYEISIPVAGNAYMAEADDIIDLCRRAGISKLWLIVPNTAGEKADGIYGNLAERLRFFRDRGFETGVWVCPILGYGSAFRGDRFTRKRLYIPHGKKHYQYGAYCPSDHAYVKAFCEVIQKLVAAGADRILFEDDFYLFDGGLENLSCCCPRHMRLFSERIGRTVRPSQLAGLLYGGEPNVYRTEWYRLKRETMLGFLEQVRTAADAIRSGVRIGLATNRASFEHDGASIQEMARVVAGKTQPFVRLTGAPYWEEIPFPARIESARLQAHWFAGSGIECVAEGDTYPRPRSRVPAALLECFDMILRADGCTDGIMKYMTEYTANAQYETGYFDAHIRHMDAYAAIDALFKDAITVGIDPFVRQNTILDRVFDDTESFSDYAPWAKFEGVEPPATTVLTENSLPVAYGNTGYAHVVFGENARHIQPEQLKDGAILDFKAAIILRDRGIDTGFSSFQPAGLPDYEYFIPEKDRLPVGRTDSASHYFAVQLKETAEVLSEFRFGGEFDTNVLIGRENRLDGTASKTMPACYLYEDAAGRRFAVYTFTAAGARVKDHNSPWLNDPFRSYYRQKQLRRAAEWAQRRKLPAFCGGHPDLYILSKRNLVNGNLVVGLWNLHADEIREARIELDEEYAEIDARFGTALLEDAHTVKIVTPIFPYQYVFFTVVPRKKK